MEEHRPLALIADDAADELHTLSEMLQLLGFNTVLAHDGDQAIALFDQHNPLVVISDVYMPGKNGLMVLEYVKSKSPQTIVILITGLLHFEQLLRSSRCKPDYFLPKPFELHKMQEALKKSFEALKKSTPNGAIEERTASSEPEVKKKTVQAEPEPVKGDMNWLYDEE